MSDAAAIKVVQDVGLGQVVEHAPLPAALPRVVEFKNVTKTYNPDSARPYTAIRDITFVVEDLRAAREIADTGSSVLIYTSELPEIPLDGGGRALKPLPQARLHVFGPLVAKLAAGGGRGVKPLVGGGVLPRVGRFGDRHKKADQGRLQFGDDE